MPNVLGLYMTNCEQQIQSGPDGERLPCVYSSVVAPGDGDPRLVNDRVRGAAEAGPWGGATRCRVAAVGEERGASSKCSIIHLPSLHTRVTQPLCFPSPLPASMGCCSPFPMADVCPLNGRERAKERVGQPARLSRCSPFPLRPPRWCWSIDLTGLHLSSLHASAGHLC